ncbi:MAG: ribosomal RNA small subunit methyltransferase A [Planctomycetes bacterium]|nr:ribosomal RNA small subunit methyltransferase A [Planctomycetota bacterium]
MQTLSDIKAILATRGLEPKHRFGQNFLHDQNKLRALIAHSGVAAGDLVLEVGPGTGTLTEALLDAGCDVVACELDGDMAAIVRDRLGSRVTLIHGDCLDGKHAVSSAVLQELAGRPFRLIANLPYGAATPLVLNLAAHHPMCLGQFVTVQREVAQRLAAAPGTDAYGAATVLVSLTSRVQMLETLPGSCFWPAPRVVSAMMSVIPNPDRPTIDPDRVSAFVHRIFASRRKQLGAVLGRTTPFPVGILPSMRAETLTPTQILALMHAIA